MNLPSPYIYPGLPPKTAKQRFYEIVASVCKEHGITHEELIIKKNHSRPNNPTARQISVPKQEVMYLMSRYAKDKEIAALMGLERSTITHGRIAVRDDIKVNTDAADRIQRIKDTLTI